ncbi:uncharacterized protein LOC115012440 [Cottoperca gobio]|uniref:Uncharacterized protein LOC115012440 n=1 Tax=Cottoperca gobio TaxID=56716 RepID=A0A6J2Q9A1_COTGO|nr:uncharacterized protein LOC115012440 [Cottoperca gobio]
MRKVIELLNSSQLFFPPLLCTEDATMFQLMSFVHHRLYTAAEDILVEVEKTITLALNKAEPNYQRQKLDFLRQISAPEPPLTGEEVLQETSTHPSIREESNLSTADVPVRSQPGADTDHDWNYCLALTNFKMSKIKEEDEEIGDDSQIQEVIFHFPEDVKSEPETQVSYELQPISSDFSAAQSDGNGSNEEWEQSKGVRTKKKRRKAKILQRHNENGSQSQKEHRVCPICEKDFQYIRPFMKHIRKHTMTRPNVQDSHVHNIGSKHAQITFNSFNNLVNI